MGIRIIDIWPTLVSASLFLTPMGAMAQSSTQDPASTEQGSVSRAGGLEEIVVTAQKRRENLQDVPISVAVISPLAIKDFGVVDVLDLQKAVPGFVAQERNLNSTPYLRGIGNDISTPGDESPIAVYVDGVYRASSTATTFSLSNIDQIEVLKGPQGTLFGRNATGGVINITTKQPTQKFEATESVGYGNYNTVGDDAYISGGITDNIAANLSLHYYNQLDGWGTNVKTGKDTYDRRSEALATSWRLTLDDTTVTVSGDYADDRWNGGPGQPEGLLQGQRSQVNNVAYFAGVYNVNSDIDSYLTLTNAGGSVRVDHDFGGAQFSSISAYRVTRGELLADSDATPIAPALPLPPGILKTSGLINFYTFTDSTDFTQEVQLQSPSASTIKWIVGAFYLNSSAKDIVNIFVPGADVRGDDDLPRTSIAVYTQTTFPIFSSLVPDTNATLGGRFTEDTIEHSGHALGVPKVSVNEPEETYRSPTWRIALDHKFGEEILTYFSYNRGFKSGVYGSGGAFSPAVKPETVDAFEIGVKSDLFDRRVRLNLAAFHSTVKNLQISSTIIEGGGVSFVELLNAAAARINGIDAEVVASPINGLRLSASATILDGKYTNFQNAPFYTYAPLGGLIRTIGNATGEETNGTPRSSFTLSSSYVLPTAIGDIQFSANDAYMSNYYLTPDHLNTMPTVNLVGVAADWTLPDKRWNLRLWSNNLLDRVYYQLILPRTTQTIATPGAPRTFGVTATVKF